MSDLILKPFKDLTTKQAEHHLEDLKSAKIDPFLQGASSLDDPNAKRLIILVQENVIGFMTPEKTSMKGVQYWRAGALYVSKENRKKGNATSALRIFFQSHRPGIAWIEDTNVHSIRAFEKIGFYKWKPKQMNDLVGHWYLLDKVSSIEKRPAFIGWR